MNYGADLSNSGADALGAGVTDATKGIDGMGFSVNTLLAGITEMGGALDTLSKNPLMTYAFFEKVNNMWKHKYTNAVRDAVGMTDELQKKTLSYLSAVERGSAIVAAFTYNVGASAIEMRKAGMELQKYANMPQLGGGGNAGIGARYQYAGAQATAQYGSEFSGIRQQIFKDVVGRMGFDNVNKNVINAMSAVQQTRGFNMGGTYIQLMEQYQNLEGMNSQKVIGLQLQAAQAVDEGKYSRGNPNQAFSSFWNNVGIYRGMDIGLEESIYLADINSRMLGDNRDKDGKIRGLGLSGSMGNDIMQKFAIDPGDISKRVSISRFLGPGADMDMISRAGGGAPYADAVRDYLLDPEVLRGFGFGEGTISSFGINRNMRTLQGKDDMKAYSALMLKGSKLGMDKGDYQMVLGMRDIEFSSKNFKDAAVILNDAAETYKNTADGENEYTNIKEAQIRKNASLMDRVTGLYGTVNTAIGQGGNYLDENLGISSSDLQLLALGIGGPLAVAASGNVLNWAGRQMGIQQPVAGGSRAYVPTPGLSPSELRKEQAAFSTKSRSTKGGILKGGRWASGLKGMAGLTLLDAAMNFTDNSMTTGEAVDSTLKTGAMLVGSQILLNVITSIGTKLMASGGVAAGVTTAAPIVALTALGVGGMYLQEQQDISDFKEISDLSKEGREVEANVKRKEKKKSLFSRGSYWGGGAGPSSMKMIKDLALHNENKLIPSDVMSDMDLILGKGGKNSAGFGMSGLLDPDSHDYGINKDIDIDNFIDKKKKTKELAGPADSTLNVLFSMGGAPLGSTAISPGQVGSIRINIGGVLTG